MAQDAFPGFTKETVQFLQDLKANNTRDWFATNKSTYENAVKIPGRHFCDALAGQLQILTGAAHKSKVFRIHRDLRFSKDKTPYNAHLHISFIPESKMAAPPCWFFGLAPDRLTVGAGIFAFDKPALEAYRQRVDGKDGAALAALLETLEQDGVRTGDIELKRVPAGYAQDHARADLLRRKGLSVWKDFKDTRPAIGANAVENCLSAFTQLKPICDWLAVAGK